MDSTPKHGAIRDHHYVNATGARVHPLNPSMTQSVRERYCAGCKGWIRVEGVTGEFRYMADHKEHEVMSTAKFNVLVRIESSSGSYERTVAVDVAASGHIGGSEALAISAAVMQLDAEGIEHVTVIKATKVQPS